MDALPILRIGGLIYPAYNLIVIAVGAVAALLLWAGIYRTRFGVMLRATSQDRRMASALIECRAGLSAFAIGCFTSRRRPSCRTKPPCWEWVSTRLSWLSLSW
jgi:branched-subunit amino acid ABC-type transport system permease component